MSDEHLLTGHRVILLLNRSPESVRDMRNLALLLVIVAAIGCHSRSVSSTPSPVSVSIPRDIASAPTASSLQMLVVITSDWSAIPGVMRRYRRDGVRTAWRAVGPEVPVVVGAAGLGWGDGLHGIGSPGEGGPIKREGDNRSPAGVFRLTSAFGYAPKDSDPWIKLPYAQATPMYKCVDDIRSVHYNQMLFSGKAVPTDWTSAEDMRRRDSLYQMGVVVEHNGNGHEIGGGSCIFLHIWPGPDGNTSGCTAFASDAMNELLAWLEPDALPILVQLPRSSYERLRQMWGLP